MFIFIFIVEFLNIINVGKGLEFFFLVVFDIVEYDDIINKMIIYMFCEFFDFFFIIFVMILWK